MLKLHIYTDNAAFEGPDYGPEIARILRDIANQYEMSDADDKQDIPLFDINGNRVGDASND